MNHLQLVGLLGSLALLVSCETTQTAGEGNQEKKRLAAVQQQEQQPQPDESEQNLWNAQRDKLNRDSNPLRDY